ncbi:hypothetical protein NP233_g6852 [Leucocoprinus birnbaumii]|uniref:Uncharacterized protein n=1 Tax=Leucocoprinus birnbaumii TaxID=56174 RepID=A0AAD5YTB6_9AGAR|nr:hypothetical protein NP233_g6852 [Leucocoprinus birnbaumii]
MTSSSTATQASLLKCSNDKEERPNKYLKMVNAVKELEDSLMEPSAGDIIIAAIQDAGDATGEGDSESWFTIVQPPLKCMYNRKEKLPATVAAASMQYGTGKEGDTRMTKNNAEQSREAQSSLPVSIKLPEVIIWECKVTDAITSEFPVTVHVLIDSGAALVLISEKVVSHLGTSSAGPTLIPSAFSAHKVLQIPPTIDGDLFVMQTLVSIYLAAPFLHCYRKGNYINTVPANLENSYRWGWERTHSTDKHSRYTHVYLCTTPEFMLQVIQHLVYQLNHPSPPLPAPVYHHSLLSSLASASPASASDETMKSKSRTSTPSAPAPGPTSSDSADSSAPTPSNTVPTPPAGNNAGDDSSSYGAPGPYKPYNSIPKPPKPSATYGGGGYGHHGYGGAMYRRF